MKILLVDNDRDLIDLLSGALRRAGYTVAHAFDAPSARRALREDAPDLVILDINLPSASGFDILRELRRTSDLPVLLLTARSDEDDKVLGFDLGADDYITKPFGYRELLARVRSIVRPRRGTIPVQSPSSPETLQVGPLTLDVHRHRAMRGNQALGLTVTEFRLLRYLMLNAGEVVPHRLLLEHVWGYDDTSADNVVRVAVHRLRQKIEEDPTNPELLITVPGVGVMLDDSNFRDLADS